MARGKNIRLNRWLACFGRSERRQRTGRPDPPAEFRVSGVKCVLYSYHCEGLFTITPTVNVAL